MGLDAYVPCNCVARGLAKPSPVALVLDEDGLLACADDADFETFYGWRATACTHPQMEAARERISNWPGVRMLQAALKHVGEPCATLLAQLPDLNGGFVDPATSAICIEQIETFRRSFRRTGLQLVDTRTGEAVHRYIAAYDGRFFFGPTEEIGFDRDGLFVFDRVIGAVRFRARRVTAVPDVYGCKLYDTDDKSSATRCGWSHTVETSYEVLSHLETEADYEDMLTSLDAIFRAAVEQGTMVVWT